MGTCGLLFYALARTRAEPWPCLLATLVLLFLGSAFEVLATPYGIVILLPVALGLAALVCLERFPGQGDLPACLLLIAAVASQSVGLAFVVGATVVLVQQSGRAAVARLWVVLAPGALYVAWFAWSRLVRPRDPGPGPARQPDRGPLVGRRGVRGRARGDQRALRRLRICGRRAGRAGAVRGVPSRRRLPAAGAAHRRGAMADTERIGTRERGLGRDRSRLDLLGPGGDGHRRRTRTAGKPLPLPERRVPAADPPRVGAWRPAPARG